MIIIVGVKKKKKKQKKKKNITDIGYESNKCPTKKDDAEEGGPDGHDERRIDQKQHYEFTTIMID